MAREERYSRNFMASSTSSTPGFGYPDPNLQTHLGTNQIHAFGSDPEIFNLTTGMEMIGFNIPSSKPTTNPQHHHQNHPESSSDFYEFYTKPEFTDWETHNARFVPDDSSLRCVFPSQPHPGPSQSLSLSLNPASQAHPQGGEGGGGGGGGGDGFLVGRYSGHGSSEGTGQEVRSSKYLGPAQELLNEFCSLGITEVGSHHDPHKQKHRKSNHSKDWVNAEDLNASGSSSSTSRNNSSLDFVALQKRKSKLMLMLDEVERRYKHYCDQMKAVVSSCEAVAGEGAATVYSAVASNTMSRHFRRLRDGIVGQIKATNKVMGEEASAIRPGTTRGETPRLRVLEQTIRQQKAFQQLNMVEGSLIAWRPQRGLPEQSVSVLRSWLFEHFLHPYPSDVDKHILARQTGLSRSQVSNWFINARVRLWKPMVEEMYLEETKDHQQPPETSSPSNAKPKQDLKPKPDELMGEAVGIVEPPPPPPFGTVELDFTNYNQQYGSGLVSSYLNNNNANPNFGGVSGGGVSLTLGLQQQQGGGRGDGGVSLAFSPSQSSLFYSRGHIEDRGSVQYSVLEGANDTQNLPYRNLMGAQLLHDLAG